MEHVVFTLYFTVFYALLWNCPISASCNFSADKLDVAISASTKQHPQGFNNSQSNAVHMTLLHPPPPPHPFCEQQRNLHRNNRFNEATSSRFQQISVTNAVHMTLLHQTHPPTPNLYTITTFIVHDKTEGSWKPWGTPSLEPITIYIYTHTLFLEDVNHYYSKYYWSEYYLRCCQYLIWYRFHRFWACYNTFLLISNFATWVDTGFGHLGVSWFVGVCFCIY